AVPPEPTPSAAASCGQILWPMNPRMTIQNAVSRAILGQRRFAVMAHCVESHATAGIPWPGAGPSARAVNVEHAARWGRGVPQARGGWYGGGLAGLCGAASSDGTAPPTRSAAGTDSSTTGRASISIVQGDDPGTDGPSGRRPSGAGARSSAPAPLDASTTAASVSGAAAPWA